ncbi:hypothetical protein P12x_003336 [Tundrisphaera lichenicola]|uniref:hypothetical protein n=1 Tax=Tundrisphaera lichenicola TaxID=2029860 RepID=UPI003EBC25FB
MLEELFIDEQGRFQMPSDQVEAFLEFLRENKVPCTVKEPNAFNTEGRSYSYANLDHRYDAEEAASLYRNWRSFREANRESSQETP